MYIYYLQRKMANDNYLFECLLLFFHFKIITILNTFEKYFIFDCV